MAHRVTCSTTPAIASPTHPQARNSAPKRSPKRSQPIPPLEGDIALQPARILALPPEGAAQALNISRGAVYRLIAQARQGDPDGLPSIKVGKRRLVPVSALEAFIQRRLEAAS